MRLVRDHSPGAYSVTVPCIVCGSTHYLSNSVVDLDGPSFKAYYCERHVPEGPIERCKRDGCARSECCDA